MKRFVQFFLVFMMLIALLPIPVIHAISIDEYTSELRYFGLRNSKEIVEINGGDQIAVDYMVDMNIPEDYNASYTITAFYTNSDGSIVGKSIVDEYMLTFEGEKYKYDELEFLLVRLTVKYNIGEGNVWVDEYYSPFTLDTIRETINNSPNEDDYIFFTSLDDSTYKYMDIQNHTIVFKDHQELNNPSITSFLVEQDGNIIETTFTTEEVKKGNYTYLGLTFEHVSENYFTYNISLNSSSIEYIGIVDGKATYKAIGTLNKMYDPSCYGEYSLTNCYINDVANQERYIDNSQIPNLSEQSIIWDKDLNIVEQLNEEDFYVSSQTVRASESLFIMPTLQFDYENETYTLQVSDLYDENGQHLSNALDGLNIDTTQPQTIVRKLILKYCLSEGIYKTVEKEFTMNIIDANGLGTLVDYEDGFEICAKRENIINENNELDVFSYPFSVPVLLNDGTYSETIVSFGMGNQILINDEDCPYGWIYALFTVPIEFNPRRLNLEYRIYLQDDNRNLVDKFGNIIIKYEDREDIIHETNNDAVSVVSQEGSIPTYTTVLAEEENVDDLFQEESIAYDITLEADHSEVKPVDGVEVSIELPSSLQNNEVEVYHVSDDGTTELVDTVIASDSVTFEAEHFSTYAVVKKEATNPSEPELNDTTAPNTGDTTNIAGLLSMMLMAAGVFVISGIKKA